ncbi:MAG TPA: tetratricopeptide repeat protein [Panacibacter sp.]|nr:tetratricopeptide repeat protein [Panacibacter sp.]HNP43139.1 tetratricopeptide repeat protein [Panacibacter sp.]
MKKLLTIYFLLFFTTVQAQQANSYVQQGNDAYNRSAFAEAMDEYKKALSIEPDNNAALFNSGNTLHKLGRDAEAEKYYEKFNDAVDRNIKAKAMFNKAVVQVNQHKLTDAIESFKQSLMLDPADNDARENLQKAINELRKQQQANKPNNQSKPKDDKNKSKEASQETINQKFDELRDKEKQLQKALRKKPTTKNPEKDW